MKYFLKCLRKCTDLKGRARRAEYWWFSLAQLLIRLGVGLLGLLLVYAASLPSSLIAARALAFSGIFLVKMSQNASYVLLIPFVAVGVRRLHDTGHSGWWSLLPVAVLTPILWAIAVYGDSAQVPEWVWLPVSAIVLGVLLWYFILLISDSQSGPNKYGPNPKGVEASPNL